MLVEIIRQDEEADIVLPDGFQPNREVRCVVEAIGNIDFELEAGDRVLLSGYNGIKIDEVKDRNLILVPATEICAVIR